MKSQTKRLVVFGVYTLSILLSPQTGHMQTNTASAAPDTGQMVFDDSLIARPVRSPGLLLRQPPQLKICEFTAWCSPDQLAHVAAIVAVGREKGLDKRACVVAVATAMQESTLQNVPNPQYPVTMDLTPIRRSYYDHDSVGLFQQRPSQGWGSATDLMDPRYAAEKFFGKLAPLYSQHPDWPIAKLAQTVQVSAYPNAYAKHEAIATELVDRVF